MTSTYYQSGRKDAFPGYVIGFGKYFPENSIEVKNKPFWSQYASYENATQDPGTIYLPKNSHDWCDTPYYNTWAANLENGNMDDTHDGHVKAVKTIYDPCPVGFQIPNACLGHSFTEMRLAWGYNPTIDFTRTDPYHTLYVQVPYDNGWNFYTNKEETETVYFPAQGYWTGNEIVYPNNGYYWVTYRGSEYNYNFMQFSSTQFRATANNDYGKYAMNVRPMVEEK